MKAKLNKKSVILCWARNEMFNFIERIEDETHIGLMGERYSIQKLLEYDVETFVERNKSFSVEMLKSFFNSLRILPWKAALILRYKDIVEFSDEELLMAQVYGKNIPPELLERKIIK